MTAGGDSMLLINYIMSILYDYLWILDLLSFILISLVAITIISIIFLRRLASAEQTHRLIPLGLTQGKNIQQNLFSVSFALLPIFIIAPMLMFLLCHFSVLIFTFSGVNIVLPFCLQDMVFISLLSFVLTILTELFICGLVFPREKLKVKRTNLSCKFVAEGRGFVMPSRTECKARSDADAKS